MVFLCSSAGRVLGEHRMLQPENFLFPRSTCLGPHPSALVTQEPLSSLRLNGVNIWRGFCFHKSPAGTRNEFCAGEMEPEPEETLI